MKHLKTLSLAALAAMALVAVLGTSSASGTTLEVGGVTQNQSVSLALTLKSGTSAITTTTSGFPEHTCTQSQVSAKTSTFTGATVTAPVSAWAFSNCNHPVTVHKLGTLHISHIAGTTNGTVTSSGTEMTKYSTLIGGYVNCKTGAGTHIGTLTGVNSGHATLHIVAVKNCGFFLPSARWEATYTVTSPTGLGVSA